jgi:NADH-quinone oxidoreductase subunit A
MRIRQLAAKIKAADETEQFPQRYTVSVQAARKVRLSSFAQDITSANTREVGRREEKNSIFKMRCAHHCFRFYSMANFHQPARKIMQIPGHARASDFHRSNNLTAMNHSNRRRANRRLSSIVTLWAFGVYLVLVIALVIAMLAVSYVLGQRHREPATTSPYECGIVSVGSAHVRLSAKFYLIAMFFVIFDLEAVFVFAWAVAGRVLGWTGYWEILIFSGVLIAALIYLWRLGALDWGSIQRHAS